MFQRVTICLLILLIGVAIGALRGRDGVGRCRRHHPVGPNAWRADLAMWTAVVFLCLLAILAKFAWKPIAEGLEKREQNVADQIAQAEAANQKAKDILAEYERKLAAAQEQVHAILEQGRHDAEQTRPADDRQGEGGRQGGIRAGRQANRRCHRRAQSRVGRSRRRRWRSSWRARSCTPSSTSGDHAQLIEQAVAGFVAGKQSDENVCGRNFTSRNILTLWLNPATSPPRTPAPRPKSRPTSASSTSPTSTPRACSTPRERAGRTAAVARGVRCPDDRSAGPFSQAGSVLASTLVSPEEKIGHDRPRARRPQVSPTLVNFLKVVARHGRLDCLRAIHRANARRSTTSCGTAFRVRLTTATPLDPAAARRRIAESLRRQTGR